MAESAGCTSDSEIDIERHDSTTSGSSSESALLSHLKAPRPSDMARKRRVDVNLPWVKRGRGHETNDPKTILASERVQNYTKEPFTVSNRKLFLFRLSRRVIT